MPPVLIAWLGDAVPWLPTELVLLLGESKTYAEQSTSKGSWLEGRIGYPGLLKENAQRAIMEEHKSQKVPIMHTPGTNANVTRDGTCRYPTA